MSFVTKVRSEYRWLDLVTELGETLLSRWEREDFDEEGFADLAYGSVTELDCERQFDWREIVRTIVTCNSLPYQQHFESPFGQPPLTAFWHARFHIQLLFWTTATPAVHNHGFSGAFKVINGSSLHSTYEFVSRRQWGTQLHVGELAMTSSRVLRVGDCELIRPGTELIHSVFHLDCPSVTLVARTHSAPHAQRFEYLPPAVALDPTVEDQVRTRRLQCLSLLASVGASEYRDLGCDLVRSGDALTVFLLLRATAGLSRYRDMRESLDAFVAIARLRFDDAVDPWLMSIWEAHRRSNAPTLRAETTDPFERLLIGVLLTHPSRQAVCETLASLEGWTTADIAWRVTELGRHGVIDVPGDEQTARVLEVILARDVNLQSAEAMDSLARSLGSAPEAVTGTVQRLFRVALLRPMFYSAES